MNTACFPTHLMPLVERVYDCVTDASRWPETLEAITRAFGGVMGLIAVSDTSSRRSRFTVACGEPEMLAPLIAGEASSLPFYPIMSQIEIDEPVTIDMLYDLQGPGARQGWLDSPMNREWAAPNGLDDFFWVALMKRPARIGNLVVVTSTDHPQIEARQLAGFAALAPHVRRAITIGDLFEMERQTSVIFRSVVEALSTPVLIVSADMRILHANAAAETLLAEGQAVTSLRGRLSLPWPIADAAVTRAVNLGAREECSLGPAGIDVPLHNAPAPSVAHVLPLARREPTSRLVNEAAAAIFIAGSAQRPLPALDAIAALFGLTVAEKRVAGQVFAGFSRGEIAECNAVSDGTVKSQLAAIYDKTGVCDQRGLAALIHDLTPPTLKN